MSSRRHPPTALHRSLGPVWLDRIQGKRGLPGIKALDLVAAVLHLKFAVHDLDDAIHLGNGAPGLGKIRLQNNDRFHFPTSSTRQSGPKPT